MVVNVPGDPAQLPMEGVRTGAARLNLGWATAITLVVGDPDSADDGAPGPRHERLSTHGITIGLMRCDREHMYR
jgi:hypothetical protein